MRRFRLTALACAVAALLLVPAAAQQFGDFGVGHHEFHWWYQTGENGGPIRRPDYPAAACCQDDCRPTKAKMVDGVWHVWIDGGWEIVPEKKIKPIKAPNNGAHVCATKRWHGTPPSIICFIPPEIES